MSVNVPSDGSSGGWRHTRPVVPFLLGARGTLDPVATRVVGVLLMDAVRAVVSDAADAADAADGALVAPVNDVDISGESDEWGAIRRYGCGCGWGWG